MVGLRAANGRSPGGQCPDDLQLDLMVTGIGMLFADIDNADLIQILHELCEGDQAP